MSDRPQVPVWYDFLCPFARIAAVWLRNLEREERLGYEIVWRSFALERANLEADADVEAFWASPEQRRSILPQASAKWAEAKDPQVFETVHAAFFEANHVQRRRIGKPEVTREVLDECGLDGEAIVAELLDDRSWVEKVRADDQAADEMGVFGVPTFIFPEAQPLFVRLLDVTEGDRAAEILRRVELIAGDPLIHELKRPTGARA